jgi:hypothetical protein
MDYQKGDRVRHPSKEDWGLGEILEDSNGSIVRVFFVGPGEKTISLNHAQLEKVAAKDAAHPILDNLKIAKTSSGIKYLSLTESKNYFLEQFPEGFRSKKFAEEERDYKVRAHNLALELLNQKVFQALLNNEEYSEVCKRALRVSNATNLIFPNEKMALKDGLAGDQPKQEFSTRLFELLYDKRPLKDRFDSFANMLEEIEADKWTTASYFPFIIQPEEFMFVKPTITQHAADLCGFEISYKPKLNWLTYKSVLAFSNYLKTEISGLEPKDMIDVQSFMWCIARH